MNTDDRAQVSKEQTMEKRTPRELAAFDGGYGHRCISHHRDNPYAFLDTRRDYWEAGFDKADRELNRDPLP